MFCVLITFKFLLPIFLRYKLLLCFDLFPHYTDFFNTSINCVFHAIELIFNYLRILGNRESFGFRRTRGQFFNWMDTYGYNGCYERPFGTKRWKNGARHQQVSKWPLAHWKSGSTQYFSTGWHHHTTHTLKKYLRLFF